MTPNHKQVRNVLWMALALNLLVAALKLFYGFYSHTLSIVGDGFHSLADGASSIAGLLAVFASEKPKDKDHHYGHQKFETLATLLISAFIGLTGWEVFRHALERLTTDSPIHFHPVGLAIMIFSMIVSFSLSRYEGKKAKELQSPILEADAYHTGSDFWVSLCIIISLICIQLGLPFVDALVSMGISVYFVWIGFRLVKDTTLVLSDAAFVDTKRVKSLAKTIPGVIGCHHIRTRGLPGSAFLDLHIQVDPETSTVVSHKIAHDLERKIKEEITGIHDILIHTEPYPDPFDDKDETTAGQSKL